MSVDVRFGFNLVKWVLTLDIENELLGFVVCDDS